MKTAQKKELIKIIAAAILLIGVFVLDKLDVFADRRWILLLITLVPYTIVGLDVIIEAFKNIRGGQFLGEDFLMAVASIGALVVGEYTEAVAVMLLYSIGEMFEDYAVNKSRKSITDMMDICPEYANLETDGEVRKVDPEEVSVGDVIVIRSGERVPLDGVVISGNSALNTSALTGESLPVEVGAGSEIYSGSINGEGLLRVKVTKEFENSTVSKILELVEDAGNRKAKAENFITKFAKYYTPIVVGGAALLFIVPTIITGEWMNWLQRACTFLVISCPCALVISVPLSFFGGIGAASKQGVLIKGSNYIESLADTDTLVCDKTGTLTRGVFKVSSIHPVDVSEDELLMCTAVAESGSNHPVAKAIYEAWNKDIPAGMIENLEEMAGFGVKARISGKTVACGNDRLMRREGVEPAEVDTTGSVVHTAMDGKYIGYIIISDEIKPGAKAALNELKRQGVKKIVMLTGDREGSAKEVAEKLGLDEVHWQLLPSDKLKLFEDIINESGERKGKVAYVGDGINDAPVLMRADVGIAMGSMGSDAAIEAADVVLMDDKLEKVAFAKRISGKTMAIVRENIIFALSVKVLVLVLGLLGVANMWEAVFSDVGVAMLAILNAMRPLAYKK